MHRPQAITRLRVDRSLRPVVESEFGAILQSQQIKLENSMEFRILAEVELGLHDIEELSDADVRDPLWIACDHITDPRNFGAILRSAAFFGVRKCLIPRDRQVGLSPAAVATSMGALSLLDVYQTSSLSRTMDQLRDQGVFMVGTDTSGHDEWHSKESVQRPTLLILGSEERGLSASVRERCDRMVRISGAQPGLESLNVSVAAGILIRDFMLKKKSHT